MDEKALLTRFGLSEKEARAYLSLLTHGAGLVADVARWSDLHRADVYKALTHLKNKGLIRQHRKRKRVYYIAETPERLTSLLTELSDAFRDILPDLQKRFASTATEQPFVTFLEGSRGIQSVYDDIVRTLDKGDVFYRYSSSKALAPRNKYVPRDYEQRRDAKKLERFAITNKLTASRKKPKLERYFKIVPPEFDLFGYNITQLIYGDKVVFVDYNTETATVIENPIIAEFQRKIFKLLFDRL